MDENLLKKHIGAVIIEGLIKESHQESMDFEYAMRKLSDAQFRAIIGKKKPAECEEEEWMKDMAFASTTEEAEIIPFDEDSISNKSDEAEEDSEENRDNEEDKGEDKGEDENGCNSSYTSLHMMMAANNKQSVVSKLRIGRMIKWIEGVACALLVIIAAGGVVGYNYLSSKLCDNALNICENYDIPQNEMLDIYDSDNEEVKRLLPMLEKRYKESKVIESNHILCFNDSAEAGWQLAVAYLKLHQRRKAMNVLRQIEETERGSEVGEYSRRLLGQIE